MPWFEFKNGLLLKLADILHTLAVWLMPGVPAPGPQENDHPQGEDDFRKQWMARYKVSCPPEDWLKFVAENSGADGPVPIGGKVARDGVLSPARRQDVKTPARAAVPRKIEPAQAADPDKQLDSSQQPQSKPTGSQPESRQESPWGVARKSALPLPSRMEPPEQELSSVQQVPVAGTESTTPLTQPRPSTVLSSTAIPSRTPRQASRVLQAVRRIVAKFRPAAPSSVIPQARRLAAKPAPVPDPKSLVVSREPDAAIMQEREFRSQRGALGEAHQHAWSVTRGTSIATGPFRSTRDRMSLPDQDEIFGERNGNDPEARPQTPGHRQREVVAQVVPWPDPAVRASAAEKDPWSFAIPVSLASREPNLTMATSCSWRQSPDRELAPGLPSLPAEFRPSPENSRDSSAQYPWPDLPQIVEEDPGEPKKLLQNHERQMRVLREQRGAW